MARQNPTKDIPLILGQGGQPRFNCSQLFALRMLLLLELQCVADRLPQVVICYGFFYEINRPSAHRSDGQGHVRIAADHNRRHKGLVSLQLPQQLPAGCCIYPHIDNHDAFSSWIVLRHEGFRRRKRFRAKTFIASSASREAGGCGIGELRGNCRGNQGLQTPQAL